MKYDVEISSLRCNKELLHGLFLKLIDKEKSLKPLRFQRYSRGIYVMIKVACNLNIM